MGLTVDIFNNAVSGGLGQGEGFFKERVRKQKWALNALLHPEGWTGRIFTKVFSKQRSQGSLYEQTQTQAHYFRSFKASVSTMFWPSL